MWRILIGVVLLFGIVLQAGCGEPQRDEDALSGRILLWHSLSEDESSALAATVDTFSELNPGVEIIIQSFVDEAEMIDLFLQSADSGLGPDILLASSSSIVEFAETNAIRDVSSWLTPELEERTMPAALASVTHDDRLYGLPLAANTEVLYYDQEQVVTPAATLSDLMADASSGRYVAMSPDFADAFWGVQAFGGRLFSESGEVMLGQGGYGNWLEWLKTARDAPGFVLDGDRTFLEQQFIDGAVAYYVGTSGEFPELAVAMGDRLRVAELPSGPVGSAGPFLTSLAFLFNSASSPTQTDLAVRLATFITNGEQSAALMRSASIIPANRSVRINPRLNPNVSAMAEQARNAIPLPNVNGRRELVVLANDSQQRVLEGLLGANEAATSTALVIGEELGVPVVTPEPAVCDVSGRLVVANVLPGAIAEAVVRLTDEYAAECSDLEMEIVTMTGEQLIEMAEVGAPNYRDLDLILGDQPLLTRLVAAGRILEISPWIDDQNLQRFSPSAISAMRVRNGLYAAPLAMDVNALYVNENLVDQPAHSLDELVRQGEDGTPMILEATFDNAYWGISALSDQPPAVDFIDSLDADGLTAWLEWLIAARQDTPIDVTFRHALARQRFIEARTAYYVAPLSEHAVLERAMLPGALAARTLPSGPGGDASPILRVSGFMLPDHLTDLRIELARSYLSYLVAPENQRFLAERAGVLPVNTSTDLSDLPVVAVFMDQVRTATVYPNLANVEEAFAVGDELYRDVLENGVAPSDVVTETLSVMVELMETEADSGADRSQ